MRKVSSLVPIVHCGMNAESTSASPESGKQYLLQAAGSGGAKLGFRLGEDAMR